MKNIRCSLRWLLLSAPLLFASVLMADETEIYFADKSGTVAPNVLFLIDASGSMEEMVSPTETRMDALKSSFQSVMNTAPSNLNIGMIHYANSGLGPDDWWSSIKGVNFPISPIDANAEASLGSTKDADNLPNPASNTTVVREFLASIVNSWSASGYTPIVDSMYEAARYFKGDTVGWGNGLATLGWGSHPLTYDKAIKCLSYKKADGTTSADPPTSGNPTCIQEWGECKGEVVPDSCDEIKMHCVNDICTENVHRCEYLSCDTYDTKTVVNYKSPMQYSCQANYLVLMSDGKPEYPYSGALTADGTSYYPPSSERFIKPAFTTGYNTSRSDNTTSLEAYMKKSCVDGAAMEDLAGESIGYNSGVCGPELAEWLATEDQNEKIEGEQVVKTYTVGFAMNAPLAGKGKEYLELLASKGKGEYFPAEDSAQLSGAFKSILNQISEAASSFSSPTYTVDTSNMLANSDEVYIPLFDRATTTTWSGNIKKFTRTADGKLVGDSGTDVVNERGEFEETADDLWGPVSGAKVAVGGAASQLPPPGSRKLYTDVIDDADLTDNKNILDADNTNITDGLLVGLADTAGGVVKNILPDADGDGTCCLGYYEDCAGKGHTVQGNYSTKVGCVEIASVVVTCPASDYLPDSERKALLDFVRGDANPDPNVTTPRQHMGDMLNTKPVVVDYGDGDQRIFAATNEGFLHSIETEAGKEQWAFMPKSLLPNIKKFMDNLPSEDHVYGIDGPMTLWNYDKNLDGKINSQDGDMRVLFFGLRRGGKAYYALDITLADAPKILWKKENTTIVDDTAWHELGETWSKPSLAKMRIAGSPSTVRDVVVFGAGYDALKDEENTANRTPDKLGSDVMIVDALTGELLWSLQRDVYNNNASANPIKHSIPGDIRVMDMDRNGALDRLYFSDTGGNVWRVDMDHDLRDTDDSLYNYDDAILTQIAALGTDGDNGTDSRKFFYEPDVALIQHNGQTLMTIAIGSGYRTHPLNTQTNDRFYVLMDPNVYNEPPKASDPTPFTTITNADLINARGTLGDVGSFDSAGDSAGSVDSLLSTNYKGWYYDFDYTGEKVLAPAISFLNKVVFTTFAPVDETGTPPSDDPCEVPPNSARAYVLDLFTGKAVADLNSPLKDRGTGDKDDFVVAGVNQILDAAKIVFRSPSAADGTACKEGDCQQTVEIRVGNMEMPVMDAANSDNANTADGVHDIAGKTDLTDIMPRMFWRDHNVSD